MRIGIDLGGTKTAAALVDDSGVIVERIILPTNSRNAESVIDGLFEACETLLMRAPTARDQGPGGGDQEARESADNHTLAAPNSIGVGIPGSVNSKTGTVVFTPNLPLANIDLAKILRKKYDCPVCIENDANCAALGESIAGATNKAENAVLITLGTGLGGGLIIGGKLYTGMTGAAGELGHITIVVGGRKCGCGRLGCWESYSSTTALLRTAREFMNAHADSKLWEFCGGERDKLDGRMLFEAFRGQDLAARQTVEQYIGYLSIGIVSIINLLEPEIICIGGGISGAWDCLYEPLSAAVSAESNPLQSSSVPKTRIVKATLGNDAGIIGAAFLGKR